MSTVSIAGRAGRAGRAGASELLDRFRAAGLSGEPLSHKEVLEAVAAGAERLADLLETALPRMSPTPATPRPNG